MEENKYGILRLVQQQKEKEDAKSRYQDVSKKKLTTKISKRINTTMIGALAAIEDKFGSLWESDNPTKEQKKLKELFKEVRSAILDNGNDQIRQMEQDLDGFVIEIKKVHLEFRLEKEREE